MSENRLLNLSFEFAVAIVNLVDGVTAPKSSYMTDHLARPQRRMDNKESLFVVLLQKKTTQECLFVLGWFLLRFSILFMNNELL